MRDGFEIGDILFEFVHDAVLALNNREGERVAVSVDSDVVSAGLLVKGAQLDDEEGQVRIVREALDGLLIGGGSFRGTARVFFRICIIEIIVEGDKVFR